MSPETPSEQVPEAVAPAPDMLQRRTDELRKVYGLPQALPQAMDQASMQRELDAMRQDAQYSDLAELVRYNQLVYRKNALQRQAAAERPDAAVDQSEFATVNQAETFFEYYQSILSQTLQASDDYLVLRRTVSVVPQEVLDEERQTEIFLQELKGAMERRLNFSNAALASYLLSVQRDRRGQVMQDQQTLMRQLAAYQEGMEPAGKAAIQAGDRNAIQIHCNTLDQRIITLVAQKGHLPSKMLLALQAQRYADILRQQQAVIRDKGLARERAEWDQLSAKNKAAREGRGEPLNEREALRFQQLKELLDSAVPGYAALSEQRRDFSNRMIVTADRLSAFHERSLEMLVMQHQFKSPDPTPGATNPNPDETPTIVREKIDEVTQMRADFHRDRIGQFVHRFEEEVLTIGLPEHIEDFSNKNGREFVRHISNALSYLYTLPAPESLGIRDYLRGRLAGPLNDAMGWPADKMDLRFDQLTPEERQNVMDKMRSVADAVKQFDRQKIANVKSSLAVIQALPPAKTALGEAVKDPLPEIGRITPENVQALSTEHGLPTVYALAIRQLNEDMGDPQSGFLGEMQIFTDRINDTVDVHLDTADALFKQGDEWRRWMYALLLAALGGAAAAYLGPKIIRATVRGVRGLGGPRAPAAAPRQPRPAQPSAPAESSAGSAAEATGTTDDIVRNEQKLSELIAARSGKTLQAAETLEFLRAAEQSGAITLDRSTMALLRDSPGAQKIIAGAVKTGNPGEVARALRAANRAAGLRVTLNAVGAAADVFVIYMAYEDWKANGERIAATDNQALKDLYADANYVYAAEGTSGVVGLSVAGYSMISSYVAGEGLLAAAAAPGALILLPIAVAAVAGGYYYRKLEGVTEDWLKEEKDWLKHSQGDLLKRISERGPGDQTYWQQAASGTNAEVGWNWMKMSAQDYSAWRQAGYDRIESANAGQRFSMTRAYMGNTTNMPPLEHESDADYSKRYARYLQDSMGYLAKRSLGAFDRQYSYVYEGAELHAELMGLSRRLDAAEGSQKIPVEVGTGNGQTKFVEFDLRQYGELIGKYAGVTSLNDPAMGGMEVSPLDVIEAYRRSKIGSTLSQVALMSNTLFKGQEEKQRAINGVLQYEILDRLRHRIAGAAMRIEQTDFNGLGITGAEQAARNLAYRWVAVNVRKMIRDSADGMMERVRNGDMPTVKDFDGQLERMYAFLEQNPIQYQTDGERGFFNSLEDARKETPAVLTYGALRESLYLWPGAQEAMRQLAVRSERPR